MNAILESILSSIKKLLGPEEDYNHYDADIIFHINSALSDLNAIGIGPEEGFVISDETAKWSDFIGKDIKKFENVKEYVYLSVKLIFDPPANASLLASMQSKHDKLEWRLNAVGESEV